MPYCSICGAELSPRANFCGKCGAPVRRDTEEAQARETGMDYHGPPLVFVGSRDRGVFT